MKPVAISVLLLAFATTVGCSSTSSSTSGTKSSTTSRSSKSKRDADPLHSLTLMRQGSVLLQQQQYQEALARFAEADRVANTLYDEKCPAFLRRFYAPDAMFQQS